MPRGVCRYCHDHFKSNNLEKHEVTCKDSTPEARHKRSAARATYYRLQARKHHGGNELVIPDGKAVAKRPYNKTGLYSQAILLKGKKGRLTVQLSVPMKVALAVVRELVPHIEIDRVGVE